MIQDDGADRDPDEQRKLYRALAARAVSLLVLGTVAFRLLEDSWSWVDSFYFSAIAVTTVGFGDLTPSTDASKLFTVLYIFLGISIITTYLNAHTRRGASRRVSRVEARRESDDGA
jgi:hypothetical protein